MSERTGTAALLSAVSCDGLTPPCCVRQINTFVSSPNRFSVALEQFSDSLQMVRNQITPGKLTWPLTKEIVKETQPDYFKV